MDNLQPIVVAAQYLEGSELGTAGGRDARAQRWAAEADDAHGFGAIAGRRGGRLDEVGHVLFRVA